MFHRKIYEFESIRIKRVSKRCKHSKKTRQSFHKVIPILNETKETIDHSTRPTSLSKISTHFPSQSSLPFKRSIISLEQTIDLSSKKREK